MELSNHMNRIADITGQVTPLDVSFKATALSTQIISSNNIKVEVLEQVGSKQNPLLSGSDHAVASFTDATINTFMPVKKPLR